MGWTLIWSILHSPDCAWKMDQGVCSVEHGQCGLMAMHEPLLHVVLSAREEEAQPAELLKVQHL